MGDTLILPPAKNGAEVMKNLLVARKSRKPVQMSIGDLALLFEEIIVRIEQLEESQSG